MAKQVKAIPEGFQTLTIGLSFKDAARAIEFYKKAFGAEEVSRLAGPGGRGVMHAEVRIGTSILFVSDEFPGQGMRAPESLGGTTATLFLYVTDVDAAHRKAIAAGARELMPVADMFWGDRFGKVADPFGHEWGLATHKEDLSPEEIQRRGQAWMEQMARQR
ncbi:MAG TPA: VOC family protein, partial [Candidatus Polarisedimenticolia bacterium]|nr:VOC family protein [Candidatus Polarisedimenticolia bacterium]